MRARHSWVLAMGLWCGTGLAQEMEAVQTAPVGGPSDAQIQAQFANEPTLLEVYRMAEKEIGLHPEKIDKWLSKASWRYLVPELRGTFRQVKDDDLATSPAFSFREDPDRIIERDELDFTAEDDKQTTIQVLAIWRLNEAIFDRLGNKDIVLTQSRVLSMRRNLLQDVSEVYYERRRHQVTLAMSPPASPLAREVLELRIEELGAQLDVVTGGRFTTRLQGGGE